VFSHSLNACAAGGAGSVSYLLLHDHLVVQLEEVRRVAHRSRSYNSKKGFLLANRWLGSKLPWETRQAIFKRLVVSIHTLVKTAAVASRLTKLTKSSQWELFALS